MQAVGIIDYSLPMEAFVDILYQEDNEYYLSYVSNEKKYVEFKKIKENHPFEILFFEEKIKVAIGAEEVLCFVYGNKKLIYGKFDSIKKNLAGLLAESELSLAAKCEISGELYLNNLTSEIYKDFLSDIYYKQINFSGDINYFLNTRSVSMISRINWTDVSRKIDREARILEKQYGDFIYFTEETVHVYNFEISLDAYITVLKNLRGQLSYNRYFNVLIDNLNSENLSLNLLENNRFLYLSQLRLGSKPLSQEVIEKHLHKNIKSFYKGDIEESSVVLDLEIENKLTKLPNSNLNEFTDKEKEEFKKLSQLIYQKR